MDHLATMSYAWEEEGLMGNSTEDFILGAGSIYREERELVPSLALSATSCVLGQASSPLPPPSAYFTQQGLQGKDCSSLCKKKKALHLMGLCFV